MRPPDAALVRARAKAPLRDLQALHLSSAGIECVRHLEVCRHALRSLYADDNRLWDIEGVLVLRRLWRVDLSDNLLHHGLHKQQHTQHQKNLLAPLAPFAALGFLYLERNQLHFEDLVCLRDVHIMELRLQGNPALIQDAGGVVEYRMKVIALLPNVWILDGHYVSTAERERAIDEQDDFVQYLLANASTNSSESGHGIYRKFGSTADLWGGIVSEDNSGDHGLYQQNENASRLIERIDIHQTRSVGLSDRNRLLTIVALHNEECAVHNRYCKFAPSKFSPNARAMPRIYLQELLLALSRQTRLEIAATLAAYLEFGFARALLVEALMIQLLGCDAMPANAAEELASLPPYALSAILCVMRHQALEEESNARQELLQHRALSSELESESRLWTSMPPLFTTLLGFDKDTRHFPERTELSFATRCHFVATLLSRAASFPDGMLELRSERRSGKDASATKSLAELLLLVQISKMVANYNESNSSRLDGEESAALMGSWISGDVATTAIRITDIRRERTDRLPWKTKSLERDYARPWNQAATAMKVSLSTSALDSGYSGYSDTSSSQQSVKRKPRPGEWLEVKSKQFFKIRQLSEDGSHVVAFSSTESSSSFTIHVDQLSRVSNSMWRFADRDLSQQLFEKNPRSSPLVAGKLGKLHRDNEGFHRHGAARSQGFPNHFVTNDDLQEMERVASDNQQPQRTSDQVAQPVALFCSNDTVDSNFVLAPPQLVSAQNFCAIKSFRELGQSPAGLWSPIKQAPFAMLAAAMPSTSRSQSMRSPASTGNLLTDMKAPRSRAPTSPVQADPIETESEWAVLQREMESVLRIKPRQSTKQSPSLEEGTLRTNCDVLCFMTAVPSQDGGQKNIPEPRTSLSSDNTPRLTTPQYPQSQTMSLSSFSSCSLGSQLTSRTVSTQPQQSKPRVAAGAGTTASWHRVSTKPQLLVSPHSIPAMGRSPSNHAFPSPSHTKPPLVQTSATPSNNGTPRTHPATQAPLKLQHCNVVLPTIVQK